MTGKSLAGILRSEQSGWIENRDVMLAGKERHDLGRSNDLGYPVRAIRTKDFLYVHNFHPERWPAGNPETDFGNCDPGPTKEVVKLLGGHFYELSFGKRLPDELYRITDDPECVRNLANDLAFKDVARRAALQDDEHAEGGRRPASPRPDGEFLTPTNTRPAAAKATKPGSRSRRQPCWQSLDAKLESAKKAGKGGKAKKAKGKDGLIANAAWCCEVRCRPTC